MELEVGTVEAAVGPFSADIVCRSLGNEHRVVIEDQLERTNHDHLGKLLTYAAGLDDVRTTVWISPEIREEHRAALDWLNSVTAEEVNFFGVELQVCQIGDRPAGKGRPLSPRAARPSRHDGKLRSIHPDTFGVLQKGRVMWPFFLEWERRAVRPSTMAARLAPYLRYFSSKKP